MKLVLILSLASAAAFAETFTGTLVNGDCYAREERNVTLRDPAANHDYNFELQQCAPNAKTKQFAIVDFNGQALMLDQSGNAKAAALVSQQHRKGRLEVTVSGRKDHETIEADSISANP